MYRFATYLITRYVNKNPINNLIVLIIISPNLIVTPPIVISISSKLVYLLPGIAFIIMGNTTSTKLLKKSCNTALINC